MPYRTRALTLVFAAAPLAVTACSGGFLGDSDSSSSSQFVNGLVEAPVDTKDRTHVEVGTVVNYTSNPPTSGRHYASWAAYTTYSTPVDPRYFVHNLEHGGIVFLYRCDEPGGCEDTVGFLQDAAHSLPDDPDCVELAEGVRVRTLVTPYENMDAKVAVAAWGWLYTSNRIDPTELALFAQLHYGQGPEKGLAHPCKNGQPIVQ